MCFVIYCVDIPAALLVIVIGVFPIQSVGIGCGAGVISELCIQVWFGEGHTQAGLLGKESPGAESVGGIVPPPPRTQRPASNPSGPSATPAPPRLPPPPRPPPPPP